MIWSDRDILNGVKSGDIAIEPFKEHAVQPASLDITLGNVFYQFKRRNRLSRLWRRPDVLDPRQPVIGLMKRIVTFEILLPPQGFLLGVTQEKVSLNEDVVARVEGKSSLGRLGLSVHTTAGFIDPGFSGYITMELSNQSPFSIRLYEGMWIGQLAFCLTQTTCIAPYGKKRGSRYTDQLTAEPVMSRTFNIVK